MNVDTIKTHGQVILNNYLYKALTVPHVFVLGGQVGATAAGVASRGLA